MEKPIETAHDKTFTWGRIGMGTFDDTADFAEVKLWGKKAESPGEATSTIPSVARVRRMTRYPVCSPPAAISGLWHQQEIAFLPRPRRT